MTKISDDVLRASSGDLDWSTSPVTLAQTNAWLKKNAIASTNENGETILELTPEAQKNLDDMDKTRAAYQNAWKISK